MLVAHKVNDFISAQSGAVCDFCIVKALKLTQQAHASQITAALGTTSDFERERGPCSICGGDKRKVIQRA